MTSAFDWVAERRIEEAVAAGALEGLPGRGLPLRLEDDSFVPAEWRMAYRVLRRAGFAPAWIEMGSEIRRRVEKARAALAAVDRSDPGRSDAEARFANAARELNREISRHNLIAPSARWHIPLLEIEEGR